MHVPSLSAFMRQNEAGSSRAIDATPSSMSVPENAPTPPSSRSVHLETYGCQMNVSDSEIVASILRDGGFTIAPEPTAADVLLINTCAIRDKAEAKIWARLQRLRHESRKRGARRPVIGLLGCMAERLKVKLLEEDRLVDLVAGPDAYRDLPNLLNALDQGHESAINVQLSLEETYADIMPVRPADALSAFVTIMRGCNNMCSFCIVPYTRGRERSRPSDSIVDEVKRLRDQGVKQVTLLGQNVNSYSDFSARTPPSVADAASTPTHGEAASSGARRRETDDSDVSQPAAATAAGARTARGAGAADDAFGVYASGFRSVYKPVREGAVQFSELLHRVAEVDPEMRIRFTSPHPKDFGDDCLAVISAHPNICKLLHMPAQSGSSSMLARMKRGYTREAYDALVAKVEATIPGVAFSSDIIVGFCGETEAEHAATLDLLTQMRYPLAFLFAYSRRDKTHAARHYDDDVPPEVKKRRLGEAMEIYKRLQRQRRSELVGTRQLVLLEGRYEKDDSLLIGRTDTFNKVCIPAARVPWLAPGHLSSSNPALLREPLAGDYVSVDIVSAESGCLIGGNVALTTLGEFVAAHGSCNPGRVLPDAAGVQLGVFECCTRNACAAL